METSQVSPLRRKDNNDPAEKDDWMAKETNQTTFPLNAELASNLESRRECWQEEG